MKNLNCSLTLSFLCFGILSGCSSAERNMNSPKFAYVGNLFDAVLRCEIDENTGQFSDCLSSGFDNFSSLEGLESFRYSSSSSVYVANWGADNVLQCSIDPNTGLFSGCEDAGNFIQPDSIAFLTLNSKNYAYIGKDDDTITQCLVDPTTGNFSQCNDSGVGSVFIDPSYNITFNEVNGTIFVYVGSGPLSDIIQKCSVNNKTGKFSNCQELNTGHPSSGAEGISFITVGNKQYAYVALYNLNIITRCNVTTDGNLTDCNDSQATLLLGPTSVNFANIGDKTFAYIPNYSGPNVIQCQLDNNTAHFINCTDSGVGGIFNYPFAVVFY